MLVDLLEVPSRVVAARSIRRRVGGNAVSSQVRVLVCAPYPTRTAPSQRYRFEQYIEPLAQEGISLEVRSLLDPKAWRMLYAPGHHAAKVAAVMKGAGRRLQDVLRASGYDAALVHREAFPIGYPVFERALAARGIPYLFDFDDATFLPNASPANRLAAPLKFPQKTALLAGRASVVVAGNQYLADWTRRHNPRVRVIPSTIDTELYRPSDGAPREPVCIGFTGSRTTTQNLRPIAPVLSDLQHQYGVRFRFIGDVGLSLPGVVTETCLWRERSEAEDLRELDIGLMPLPDTDWARGKCGMKALRTWLSTSRP